MSRSIKMLSVLVMVLVLYGCENESQNPLTPSSQTDKQTGKIVVNVTWPESAYASKKADLNREKVDIITAYIYLEGNEITHKNLSHEGNLGVANIEIAASEGYRLELIAFESLFNQVLYVGLKEDINVTIGETTTVDLAMIDVAPSLYPATITGDNSFTISWSPVPLTTSYILEESFSSDFYDDDEKLSTNVYCGSDTTVTLRDKTPRIYYYMVLALTPYDPDNLNPCTISEFEKMFYDFDFHLAIEYGAPSNIIEANIGGTGTMRIEIPWPE